MERDLSMKQRRVDRRNVSNCYLTQMWQWIRLKELTG